MHMCGEGEKGGGGWGERREVGELCMWEEGGGGAKEERSFT